jgi:hypothetical protein
MKKKNCFYGFFVVVLTMTVCFMYFQKKELSKKENFSRELFQKMTFEEKKFLLLLCKDIFYESTAGYTLFGDKPISRLCYSSEIRKGHSFFQKHLFFLVRKYEEKLNVPNFVFVIEGDINDASLYLVNKKAFLNTVQQNLSIFRNILGNDITPDGLLHSIMSKNCGFETALKSSHALFGILFGFGVENALRFDRRDRLEPSWFRQGFPPWKGIHDQDEAWGVDVMLSKLLRKRAMSGSTVITAPEKTVLSPGFLTVQDELIELNQKLVSPEESEESLYILSAIGLPDFVGDPGSEETKKLLEKYKVQKDFLTKLMAKEDFLEKVLEKFYSVDGENA